MTLCFVVCLIFNNSSTIGSLSAGDFWSPFRTSPRCQLLIIFLLVTDFRKRKKAMLDLSTGQMVLEQRYGHQAAVKPRETTCISCIANIKLSILYLHLNITCSAGMNFEVYVQQMKHNWSKSDHQTTCWCFHCSHCKLGKECPIKRQLWLMQGCWSWSWQVAHMQSLLSSQVLCPLAVNAQYTAWTLQVQLVRSS